MSGEPAPEQKWVWKVAKATVELWVKGGTMGKIIMGFVAVCIVAGSVIGLNIWLGSKKEEPTSQHSATTTGNNSPALNMSGSNDVHGQIINGNGNITVNNNSGPTYYGPLVIQNGPLSPEEIQNIAKGIAQYNKSNIATEETNFPAFAVFMAVSLRKIDEPRHKFIYDHGGVDRNRFSVYLSEDNALIFRVIDSTGDAYSVRLPPSEVIFDQFIYFEFDVANEKNSSFLRILINGSEVRRLELDHLLPVSEIATQGANVIGTDLEHQKFGSFTMDLYMSWKSTFTATQEKLFIKDVAELLQDQKLDSTNK
jgi:hypothetical protein